MSVKTLEALGISEAILPFMNIQVHGRWMTVSPSVNHFSELNVIGYSFVDALDLDTHIFRNKTVVLTNVRPPEDGSVQNEL